VLRTRHNGLAGNPARNLVLCTYYHGSKEDRLIPRHYTFEGGSVLASPCIVLHFAALRTVMRGRVSCRSHTLNGRPRAQHIHCPVQVSADLRREDFQTELKLSSERKQTVVNPVIVNLNVG
jgi:hypothetical protein